ncbi:hypothetical protein VKT23_009390 [Stygiomarasmius scandens]|uniref:BED-type domain-containing protein n=1 Tax=Marasmiellus scandens TaxID=2682957 RepID=A0ABR1JGD4_9AGAR
MMPSSNSSTPTPNSYYPYYNYAPPWPAITYQAYPPSTHAYSAVYAQYPPSTPAAPSHVTTNLPRSRSQAQTQTLNIISREPSARKRPLNEVADGQVPRNVRQRTHWGKENTPTVTSTVAGAGPMPFSVETSTSGPHPAFTSEIFKSVQKKGQKNSAAATDVWYFMMPADEEKVPIFDSNAPPKIYESRPKIEEGKWIACRLCPQGGKKGVWQNSPGGMTGNIREHLLKNHPKIYDEYVLKLHLKNAEKIAGTSALPNTSSYARGPGEPFSSEKFLELLVQWIVVDDQVCLNILNSILQ